jgi:hypothetical protein
MEFMPRHACDTREKVHDQRCGGAAGRSAAPKETENRLHQIDTLM